MTEQIPAGAAAKLNLLLLAVLVACARPGPIQE